MGWCIPTTTSVARENPCVRQSRILIDSYCYFWYQYVHCWNAWVINSPFLCPTMNSRILHRYCHSQWWLGLQCFDFGITLVVSIQATCCTSVLYYNFNNCLCLFQFFIWSWRDDVWNMASNILVQVINWSKISSGVNGPSNTEGGRLRKSKILIYL